MVRSFQVNQNLIKKINNNNIYHISRKKHILNYKYQEKGNLYNKRIFKNHKSHRYYQKLMQVIKNKDNKSQK